MCARECLCWIRTRRARSRILVLRRRSTARLRWAGVGWSRGRRRRRAVISWYIQNICNSCRRWMRRKGGQIQVTNQNTSSSKCSIQFLQTWKWPTKKLLIFLQSLRLLPGTSGLRRKLILPAPQQHSDPTLPHPAFNLTPICDEIYHRHSVTTVCNIRKLKASLWLIGEILNGELNYKRIIGKRICTMVINRLLHFRSHGEIDRMKSIWVRNLNLKIEASSLIMMQEVMFNLWIDQI